MVGDSYYDRLRIYLITWSSLEISDWSQEGREKGSGGAAGVCFQHVDDVDPPSLLAVSLMVSMCPLHSLQHQRYIKEVLMVL